MLWNRAVPPCCRSLPTRRPSRPNARVPSPASLELPSPSSRAEQEGVQLVKKSGSGRLPVAGGRSRLAQHCRRVRHDQPPHVRTADYSGGYHSECGQALHAAAPAGSFHLEILFDGSRFKPNLSLYCK